MSSGLCVWVPGRMVVCVCADLWILVFVRRQSWLFAVGLCAGIRVDWPVCLCACVSRHCLYVHVCV